ncbi:molecular chaperone DnaJ [Candidatus Woesearchaeota archaeon]|nr:MAG: molecular chaperone DnaJ [Candidatus Woesearchaeota archaeon]
MNYYDILGVSKSASKEEIKRAYKRLALKYHPDRNPGNKEAEEQFKKINEAASVLTDDKKRAQYDAVGHDAFTQGARHGAGAEGFGGGFSGNFEDIFESIFGQGFADIFGGGFSGGNRRRRPTRGYDLQYDLDITLEDVVRGLKTQIVIPRFETCDSCQGTGAASPQDIHTCSTCKGQGIVRQAQRTPFGVFHTQSTCPTCGGEGKRIDKLCDLCGGDGRIKHHRKIEVNVPAGVEEGTQLRLEGQGSAGENGAPPGDLYVVIHVKDHKVFERRGHDLFISVPISFVTATLGGEIEVPTIEGTAKLKIPKGTQSNTTFRMKGKGIPFLRGSGRGDQLVKVIVHTPQGLSKKQEEYLRKFEESMKEKMMPKKGFFEKLRDVFD